MTTFFFISLGIFIVGFLLKAFAHDFSGWEIFGIVLQLIGGICLAIWFVKLMISDVASEVATKNETTDSTQVQIPKDSIGEMIFVISWKDEDGVWAGQNIKLKDRTEKNIGDTINIKLPQ